MNAIAFPNMLNHAATNLVKDKEAIRQDMVLLLSSECATLFGDPYFGSQLKKYIFEQATSVVADLLVDELYTCITTFMPQVFVTRKDIHIYTSKNVIFAEIKYYYTLDNTHDLFTIKLIESTDEE